MCMPREQQFPSALALSHPAAPETGGAGMGAWQKKQEKLIRQVDPSFEPASLCPITPASWKSTSPAPISSPRPLLSMSPHPISSPRPLLPMSPPHVNSPRPLPMSPRRAEGTPQGKLLPAFQLPDLAPLLPHSPTDLDLGVPASTSLTAIPKTNDKAPAQARPKPRELPLIHQLWQHQQQQRLTPTPHLAPTGSSQVPSSPSTCAGSQTATSRELSPSARAAAARCLSASPGASWCFSPCALPSPSFSPKSPASPVSPFAPLCSRTSSSSSSRWEDTLSPSSRSSSPIRCHQSSPSPRAPSQFHPASRALRARASFCEREARQTSPVTSFVEHEECVVLDNAPLAHFKQNWDKEGKCCQTGAWEEELQRQEDEEGKEQEDEEGETKGEEEDDFAICLNFEEVTRASKLLDSECAIVEGVTIVEMRAPDSITICADAVIYGLHVAGQEAMIIPGGATMQHLLPADISRNSSPQMMPSRPFHEGRDAHERTPSLVDNDLEVDILV